VDIETLEVRCNGGLPGFLAMRKDRTASPLVVLMHERYGLVRHTRDLATRLARDGYTCIAPDFFFRHPDQDALHRGETGYVLSDPEALESLDAAVDYVREQRACDPVRLAVIGVCQTGRFPIVYGAHRPLTAAIAWYGAASKREWAAGKDFPEPLEELIGRLGCPMLGVFGERDHVISVDDVKKLRNALEHHGKSYEIKIFADAPHGWLNDTMPGRYRREQAEAGWALQARFLAKCFGEGSERSRIVQKFSADFAQDYDFGSNKRLE